MHNLRKKKTQNKARYIQNRENAKLASRARYRADPEKKRAVSRAASRASYSTNPEKKKATSRASYRTDPDKKKVASRAASRASYSTNPDKKKAASRASYSTNPDKKKAASRASYRVDPDRKRAAVRMYYARTAAAKLKWYKKYYQKHRGRICASKRGRYALAEPKPVAKEFYVKELQHLLLKDDEARVQLVKAYKRQYKSAAKRLPPVMIKAVCRIAAKRLLNKVLQVRKEHAGSLLKTARVVSGLNIKGRDDFGEGCHTASSEPFYYDAAYQPVQRACVIPIDENGRCVVTNEISSSGNDTSKMKGKQPLKWCCSSECKTLTEAEVAAVVNLKQAFEKPMEELRAALYACDSGCPNGHYTKAVVREDAGSIVVDLQGHTLPCFNDGGCCRQLRILRAASTHYSVLRTLLNHVYSAITSHLGVLNIDKALSTGDLHFLKEITKVPDFAVLLTNDLDCSYEQHIDATVADSVLKSVESRLLIAHAQVINDLEKEIDDDPEHACCSCERLHQRKSVTKVKLSDSLGSKVWPALKAFIVEQNPDANEQVLYMCNYCKALVKKDEMPPHCVLNGLQTISMPPELAKLDCLSRQLIQRAKCYQTVVRLGAYTAKVPVYNSLKACKGTMFFLPLPFSKTLKTLEEVEHPSTALPEPELYIIVNGRPTKGEVVWRSLVNVDLVKTATKTLKEINWLYKDVDVESVDEAVKRVVEVTNSASSMMLQKASTDDIADFQAYTIRNLDNKLSSESDIEQYKVLSIKEDPLDNRENFLDVMCFPVLFPTGQFGEHHPRQVKLSHSEYVKSRLLNKDSRYRKDPQYVFFLLWQKEMREISAGVYNLLKSTRRQPMSVSALLHGVATRNEHLEANLCTMLQSVRGTKQYWFAKQSELRCMIRASGPPTLFLTFSCAEYESADIDRYLRKVNDVSPSYSIGKLCTDDPVSVSRKFSLKFHAFFRTVLLKGAVLGEIDHYYWKKEYQARGAPHYHVLLWIRDAPVIGHDDPERVLAWLQERITCHIPDKASDPDLHRLVTRYQMHKCSAYCKRRRKCGRTFITRCKFGFPRQACKTATLNCVDDALKSRQKIYQLPRTELEVRVNDYNPLLLILWKANIDVQYVAESSLALAHYVSGYVTKAEKSNLQDIWHEVSENKSIYSQLWSFGVRSLRSRECGLYEASDLLLGDHLTEKSDAVKWVDVSLPHKRSRRLKDHKVLEDVAKRDPDSEDIFQDNLLDNHYPRRPSDLEGICLYDFVANYDYCGTDSSGKRKYRKLTKPRLPNHKLFDPEREDQRDAYYYSLLLLFVPFRDESTLLLENETTEEAFRRLLPDDSTCSAYHGRLQKMLQARANIKQINDARQADGEEHKISKQDDDPQLLGEAKTAMKELFNMNAHPADTLSLKQRVAMLNADQRRIFDRVKDHLLHQQQHEADECCCDLTPLRMFVSGVGGTGKLFLIETIKALVHDLWPSDDLTCAIAAPTGLAAFNVGGITIHRLFQLPIEHEGKAAEYWALPKSSQKVMKTTLRSVKIIIVDEVSMVSSLNFAYMHLRLEELFGSHDWFGSKNMLFVGDLLQLQPVNGHPVFEIIPQKSLQYKLGCATSVNIWRDAITYDELTINERQKKDVEFSSMLDCVRCGQPTDETLNLLKKQVIEGSAVDKFVELQQSEQSPVCLFPRRKACDHFNNEMLNRLTSQVHNLFCTDEVDETCSTRKWSKKAAEQLEKLNNDCNLTAGLEAKLTLAVGARVMLRRNIDTNAGLVNGAIGTVLSIRSDHVSVQFDHISEPYDVEKVKSRFMVMKNYYVYRKQFPLILAYAVTIHKCQGLSLDCAIVDLSDKVFSAGMAYVAISRVRTLAGLHLVAFDPNSIMVSTTCLKEVNRLRQVYRPDLKPYPVAIKPTTGTKRKLTGNTPCTEPECKKARHSRKRRRCWYSGELPCTSKLEAKKPKQSPPTSKSCPDVSDGTVIYCGREHCNSPNAINRPLPDELWRRQKICVLSQYSEMSVVDKVSSPDRVRSLQCNEISPHIRVRVQGDGNCLFRAISRHVTGTECNHYAVRKAAVNYLHQNPSLIQYILIGVDAPVEPHERRVYFNTKVQEYLVNSRMGELGEWGTDLEVFLLSCMLDVNIVVRQNFGPGRAWQCIGPSVYGLNIVHNYALYVYNTRAVDHYDCVIPVLD